MMRVPLALLCAIGLWLQANAADSSAGTHRMAVEGLGEPATIVIDRWGIPHIFAASIHDAYFLQGFNAARDRLWQIDLWRKRGLGLLAKSFGPTYIDQDRAARLLLYRGDMDLEWSAYAPGAREATEAFVAGINAYVDKVRGGEIPAPPEFALTASTPERWEAADVVRIRSHGLVDNLWSEVARARVTCLAGLNADQLRSKLEPPHAPVVPEGLDPCSIPADVLKDYELGTERVRFAPPSEGHVADVPHDVVPEGSNNWVISPTRSATGRPILANDPHRLLSIPSLRYIVHLEAPGLSLIGAGEPALPGVSFGHNGHVAFGLTIFESDQEDLYVYSLNPDNLDQYRYREGWESMRVVQETIEVKGQPAREVTLRFTRHGPVIALDAGSRRAFALRSVWDEPGTAPYFASTWLTHARNWQEFLAARARWRTPPLNLVYADIAGNIGWAAGAAVPVRPNWDGLLPVPGDGRYEWAGLLGGERLPSVFNPTKGWFATANEMNLPAGYPAEERKISFEWANRSRIDRIESVLAANPKFSVADSMRLQTDSHNLMSRSVIALLDSLTSSKPLVSDSIDLMKAWDGDETTASVAATIYETWVTRFLAPMTIKRITPDAVHEIIGDGALDAVLDYLEHPDARLGDSPEAARRELLLESLSDTVDDLQRRLGPDMAGWRWGRVHKMAFIPAVDPLLDKQKHNWPTLPTVELPGSGDSPRAASFRAKDFSVDAGASVRMVIDVGDWDRSMAINAPGQSGDPGSPHYGDLLPLWARGSYVPLLYTRTAIEAAAGEVLSLRPQNLSRARRIRSKLQDPR